MIRLIKALSRATAAEALPVLVQMPTTALISINDPELGPLPTKDQIAAMPNRICVVSFDDVEPEDGAYFEGMTGMHERDAYTIAQFLKRLNDDIESLYVHCTGGVSRSGAVAAIARDYFRSPSWDAFRRENPQIQPNWWVQRLLRDALDLNPVHG
jgi:predicted protein tyrosine phosphatase